MLVQDFRSALRGFRRTKALTAAAILSLALGIGANSAIFSLLDAVLLRYLPVERPAELRQLRIGDNTYFSHPIFAELVRRQDVFSGVFAWTGARFNVSEGGESQFLDGIMASGAIFRTLGIPPHRGRLFDDADNLRGGGPAGPVAVIHHAFWQRRFGGAEDVIGRQLRLEGRDFTIIGVTPPGFFGVEVGSNFDVAIPLGCEPLIRKRSFLEERSFWWLQVLARPKPGVTAEQADARLRTLSPGIFEATLPPDWDPKGTAEYRAYVLGARAAGAGTSSLRERYAAALWLLLAVAGLVLLTACANIANLLLSRGEARRREFAVRLALGASRGRLLRQLLTESLLLAAFGAVPGILAAPRAAELLLRLLANPEAPLFLDLAIDARLLLFSAALAVLTALLCGLAPAFRATRVDPHGALKAGARGATVRFGFGRLLVGLQVAISLVLVAGAGLFLRTFLGLLWMDPGFDAGNVLTARVSFERAGLSPEAEQFAFDDLLRRARAIPGVEAAALAALMPVSGQMWNSQVHTQSYTSKSDRDALAFVNAVSSGYFRTLRTSLLSGRDLADTDVRNAPRVAVVNRQFARKFFAGADPVGREIARSGPAPGSRETFQIVGLVADAKYGGLRDEVPPTMYFSQAQEAQPQLFGGLTLAVRTARETAARAAIREAALAVHPRVSLEFRSLAAQVDQHLRQERLLATLASAFAVLALILAAVGIYGTMSYAVERRRSEIGVRMALGAHAAAVRLLVLRDALGVAGLGLAAGLVGAALLSRLVGKLIFGVRPGDPATFAAAALVLLAAALAAALAPALRASRLDPMQALREE
jgi:predicted permease